MRILIGTDTYRPDVNGTSYFTQHLAAGLAARSHEVHVLCASETGEATVEQGASGVTVHGAPSSGTPFHPTFRLTPPPLGLRATSRAIRAARPDVVHV